MWIMAFSHSLEDCPVSNGKRIWQEGMFVEMKAEFLPSEIAWNLEK